MNENLAIVTGAASGIGLAVAGRLASDRRVALVDIDRPGVERAAAAIGTAARGFAADVSSSEDCAQVVAAAESFGEIGAIVNVAGVMADADTVEDIGDDALDRILDVNVKAIFRLGRHVIPRLRRRGDGVIVNVASVHAFATMPETAAYAASKGAVVALTRQMALDVASDGIRVVAVAPGSVDTPLTRKELARRDVSLEDAGFSTDPRAIARVASPAEVAEVIAWLLSPSAALLTGSTVVADAGLLARLV